MRTQLTLLVGLAVATAAAPAHAQQATERFIPLGQSPGVSGVLAYMGSISAVDQSRRTVTMSGPGGAITVRISDSTRIWVDRSAQRKSSTLGKLTDLRVGWNAEVKYLDPVKEEGAEWIKVAAPPGS
jgi:hypothetical protein